LRPNLLLVGCLGAALLPLSAGMADSPTTPAPDAAPLTTQKAAAPPAAASAPLPHADAVPAKPLPRMEAAQVLPPPPAKTTQAKPAPRAQSVPMKPAPHGQAAPSRPAPRMEAAQAKPAPRLEQALAKPLRKAQAVQTPPAAITRQAPASAPRVAVVSRPTAAAPAAVRALPDYGGRDGITGTASAAQSSPVLNPLAQAWRAFEALVIVLALVVGGLYLLKRSGMLKPDGSASGPMPLLAAMPGFLKALKPAKTSVSAPSQTETSPAPWITMLGSQALPTVPGASLHLISVGGKTLLLGATAQSVALISEVDAARREEFVPSMDTGQMPSSFDGYLVQADQSPLRQSNETELLMGATTMRLQAMIARSEAQSSGHRPQPVPREH